MYKIYKHINNGDNLDARLKAFYYEYVIYKDKKSYICITYANKAEYDSVVSFDKMNYDQWREFKECQTIGELITILPCIIDIV